MTECMVLIVGDADVLDCCTILTAIGEGIELRRVVQPEERAS